MVKSLELYAINLMPLAVINITHTANAECSASRQEKPITKSPEGTFDIQKVLKCHKQELLSSQYDLLIYVKIWNEFLRLRRTV